MKSQYEVVSEVFISNCLIQAVKARISNKNVKIYFCKPRITENGHFQMFHFMWDDGEHSYDFTNIEDGGKRWYRSLLFKGYVRKFNLEFARKYTEYRNGCRKLQSQKFPEK